MKRATWVLATTIFVCSSAPAHAGPGALNLSWGDCGAFGTSSRAFACDTNTGLHTLVGSFVAPSFLDAMNGCEVVIDVAAACPTYPDWWAMRTGGCRTTASLFSSFDFTGGPFNCHDYWQGGAVGGILMEAPIGNRSRIKTVCALPIGDSRIGPVAEGTEVYAFKATINSAKTVGPGACAGCEAGVCLELLSILLTQVPGTPAGNKFISTPGSNIVGWQSGSGWDAGPIHGGFTCSGDCPTPTLDRTWGQIKSLYR